jgi:hypothetical protein
MGGLGNQLFQIFATISYAIKIRKQFKFSNIKNLGSGSTTIRKTYWDDFLSRLKIFTINEFPKLHLIREKDYTFNELPMIEMLNPSRDILIFGYFQSYKYFQSNYEIICRMIGLETLKENLLKKINYEVNYFDNSVSMHFRIGDYKKVQDYHPILNKDYYKKCLEYIQLKKNNTINKVIYFCEDDDLSEVNNIIEELVSIFQFYKFIRVDNKLEDWEQMLLMSCCENNIIANSSFSWWGAYFNDKKDKIVCYPSVWFGPAAKHNTIDLCPLHWVKIET